MGEKRQISHAEEFQVIYVDILLLSKGNITPNSLSVGRP